jgi:hypothetical protein
VTEKGYLNKISEAINIFPFRLLQVSKFSPKKASRYNTPSKSNSYCIEKKVGFVSSTEYKSLVTKCGIMHYRCWCLTTSSVFTGPPPSCNTFLQVPYAQYLQARAECLTKPGWRPSSKFYSPRQTNLPRGCGKETGSELGLYSGRVLFAVYKLGLGGGGHSSRCGLTVTSFNLHVLCWQHNFL